MPKESDRERAHYFRVRWLFSLLYLLRQGSAHWLRHTAGSNMANGDMDMRHVRDNLGHESISTTSQYLHSADDQRHRDTEEKRRLRW